MKKLLLSTLALCAALTATAQTVEKTNATKTEAAPPACLAWKGRWLGTWPFVSGERTLNIQSVDQNCVANIKYGNTTGEFKIENNTLTFQCPPSQSTCRYSMNKDAQSLDASHQRPGMSAGNTVFKKKHAE